MHVIHRIFLYLYFKRLKAKAEKEKAAELEEVNKTLAQYGY